jgi:flagellar biosynthesis protein FlhG
MTNSYAGQQDSTKQRVLLEAFPTSKASLAFNKLAAKTESWPLPDSASGHLEFLERLIRLRSVGQI